MEATGGILVLVGLVLGIAGANNSNREQLVESAIEEDGNFLRDWEMRPPELVALRRLRELYLMGTINGREYERRRREILDRFIYHHRRELHRY